MIELTKTEMPKIAPLFQGWEETLIWSCLQGQMGRAWADDSQRPAAALIAIGDFFFLGGDPTSPGARQLAAFCPEDFSSAEALLIPQSGGWSKVIEAVHGEKAVPGVRYAIKKEPDVFDREKLRSFRRSLPDGFALQPIDEALYRLCLQEDWCRDLVSNFPTAEDYAARGLGFAALRGGVLAAGASSYTMYNGGIEIEIDTRQEYRRRGLATACGAALILRCLDLGLYPSWDAANLSSVALAEKLGYHFSHEYPYYACCAKKS